MNGTKACGYVRVSTDRQDTSVEKKRLAGLAEVDGYEIVQWYVDVNQRSEWLRLLTDAATAEWDVVLCHEDARVSRTDLLQNAADMQALKDAGKKLLSAVEGFAE